MSRRYFQLDVSERSAEVMIFGDITSWPWDESDVSSYGLAKQLAELGDVDSINVRINSYGGEVAEGVAIYNALRNHPAKVTTECDGFACSIASVVFMAGDERIMNEASLLMIHNAWSCAAGNAEEHRKEADDLDTVTELSKQIYLAATDLGEDELSEWMDAETFIDAKTAVERGFATDVIPLAADQKSQSLRHSIAQRLTQPRAVTVNLDYDAALNAWLCDHAAELASADDRIAEIAAALASADESIAEGDEPPTEEVHDASADRVRMAGAYLALG